MIKKLVLTLCAVLFLCTMAHADYWKRIGVFDAGKYLNCVVNLGEPNECTVVVANGSVEETQVMVDFLNTYPITTPEDPIQLVIYHWDNGYWIKYKLPWEFVRGVEM